MSTPNPYAPPQARVADVSVATTAAEAIRREHIKHEAAVRSIGTLYYFGGIMMLVLALVFGFGGLPMPGVEAPPVLAWVVSAVYAVLAVISIVVAYGLRRLRSWARVATIVLATFGLLGFPVGTLVSAYILYLLLAAKGRRVFAADYADIVAATPQVRYRTSLLVWALVFALVITAVIVIVLTVGR